MGRTVFWSWQSDLEKRVTRDVVRIALEDAVASIAAELNEADRPTVTSDTQGVPGSPQIVPTILKKIATSGAFVADVTPIAMSGTGKAIANPNVLFEMGYAVKSLGFERVIQVWNTAFAGANLNGLPFDLRGCRAPIGFNLPVDADRGTLRAVRTELPKVLKVALLAVFGEPQVAAPEAIEWQSTTGNLSDFWFQTGQKMPVNDPDHGTGLVRYKQRHHGYARMIPSRWDRSVTSREFICSTGGRPGVLGRSGNAIGFGLCQGGAMTYRCEEQVQDWRETGALTQWFEETGEVWGIDNGFWSTSGDGRRMVSPTYAAEHWYEFVARQAKLAAASGGGLPLHVRLGVTGLSDSWWPPKSAFSNTGFTALASSFGFEGTLTSIDQASIVDLVAAAINGLAKCYGLPPRGVEEIDGLRQFA